MNPTLVQFYRCPSCSGPTAIWDVREEREGDVVEGTLACDGCGGTYQVHASVPILLPKGRRAVDDLATVLALAAEETGFADGVHRVASGEISYPLTDPDVPPIRPSDLAEARYRQTESFWETFSRNRLVQHQLTAIDAHWDALEEVWLRAEINLAESILDVGTGWGGMFHRMLESGPQDALVIGLDTAFLNLQVARGRAERAGLSHATYVVGDITVPPLADDLFDSVVSWFGLGFVPGVRAGLEGVHKILAPGHSFAAAWTPALNDMDGLAPPDDLRLLSMRLDIPVDPEATVDMAHVAGFEDVELVTVGPIYVLSGRVPLE